jgi:RIO kinase 1
MANPKQYLRQHIQDEKIRQIFNQVFDQHTILTIHELATKNEFDVLEFLVNAGKEAHVYRAKNLSGFYRAVKIYKIETTAFKNMRKYLEGDMRFKDVKRNRRSLVFQWTRKEFRNLQELEKAGVRVPAPFVFKNNVLVMEFIGEKGVAAPLLKEKPVKDIHQLYEQLVECIARMLYKAKLVHADLSEYNILNLKECPVIIDCGQAVLTTHPHAREFFERDIKNMASYFSKMGLLVGSDAFKKKVKKWKKSLS